MHTLLTPYSYYTLTHKLTHKRAHTHTHTLARQSIHDAYNSRKFFFGKNKNKSFAGRLARLGFYCRNKTAENVNKDN